MSISLGVLTFHCRWQTAARLPDYAGSTLRGAFGWALKRVACMLKSQQCPDCILRRNCPYAFLFATERYRDDASHSVNARPHPLIIQPGDDCAGDGLEGGLFNFSLVIMSRASDFLPHIVHSVKLMGEAGIGAGAKHGAGRFVMENVMADGQAIFDIETGLFNNALETRKISAETLPSQKVSRLHIGFITPLRLKRENILADTLPFSELIRAVLRRITALEAAYGNEGQSEPDFDYRGLIQRAEAIHLEESTLRWRELQRYSNRQKQHVSLSGLMGTVVYTGNLDEFMPFFNYAAAVNLGKQTLFGLGRIEVEASS